jgi:hypothetical protein
MQVKLRRRGLFHFGPRKNGGLKMTDLARPRFGSINAAVATYSIGRSSIYELAREHHDLFVKFRTKTLVDYGVMDRIVDALPRGRSPRIKTGARRKHSEQRAKPSKSS